MSRQARLVDALTNAGIDGFLATSDAGIFYTSGFATHAYERLTGVLVTADGGLSMIVPALDEESASEQLPGVEMRTWSDGDDPLALVIDELKRRGLGSGAVGVEDLSFPVGWADRVRADLPGVTLVHGEAMLSDLRAVKDPDELSKLEAAARAVSDAFDELGSHLAAGVTESEASATLVRLINAAGAQVSGRPLIATGANGAKPHTSAGPRKLETGDLMVVDSGAIVDGYWGDITRCFVVGDPSPKQQEVYDIVRRAHGAAIEALRPGARTGDIDKAARTVIDEAGYGKYFVHRTGHGLGVEVHEAPFLAPGTDVELKAGMVVTIEPGIYLPGEFGVRLEDDVAVTAGAPKVFSTADRELRTVGGGVGG
ncbi:MAG: hypothetical protein QOJ13_518 [Gaiellales bacterium]|jgi:Xaa-Pro aminopeptidase|nr:hypothetical protein [Gaiellales bacterium]